VEAFTMSALTQAWHEARRPHQREHVTPYLYENPDKFRLSSLKGTVDYSQYRWTLDTVEDFHLLQSIYTHFDNRNDFGWREAIRLMEQHPELAEVNSHVPQKSLMAL
jgi:spore coat polysaccharide biosynthesis protein SpsF